MLLIYLTIAIVSVFIGAAVAFFILRGNPILFSAILGFTASAVLGIIIFQLLPHHYEELGFISLFIMGLGFLTIFLIDERIIHQYAQLSSRRSQKPCPMDLAIHRNL